MSDRRVSIDLLLVAAIDDAGRELERAREAIASPRKWSRDEALDALRRVDNLVWEATRAADFFAEQEIKDEGEND